MSLAARLPLDAGAAGSPLSWPAGPPAPPAPAPGEVHVWSVHLDVPRESLRHLAASLLTGERARAARFRFERDRERYVACRGTLRHLLGRYLQRAPREIRFRTGQMGKPELAGEHPARALRFNVSHSEEVALIAVTSGHDIGVDVERIRRLADLEAVAARFFAPAERWALQRLDEGARVAGFFRCWTQKEAVIKCTGEGLSRPLDSFDVVVDPGRHAGLLRLEGEPDAPRRWSLHALSPAPGYAAAVAVRGPAATLHRWRHAPTSEAALRLDADPRSGG